MVKLISALLALVLGSALAGQAQLIKEAPVAMGHHHLSVTDVDGHKKFWGELLGGTETNFGRTPVFKFPDVLVFLRTGEPSGGSIGTSINHVGFTVKDIKQTVAKLKEAGVAVVTQREVAGATSDIHYLESQKKYLAMVMAPDGLKVELIEDAAQEAATKNHHIHYFTTDVEGLKAWYVKVFGAVGGMRGTFQAADLPGVNLTFSASDAAVKPTKGTVLDHTGFEIDNLKAFCEKAEKMGIKFDRPYRVLERANLGLAFLTDPAGTYLELTEGLDKL